MVVSFGGWRGEEGGEDGRGERVTRTVAVEDVEGVDDHGGVVECGDADPINRSGDDPRSSARFLLFLLTCAH